MNHYLSTMTHKLWPWVMAHDHEQIYYRSNIMSNYFSLTSYFLNLVFKDRRYEIENFRRHSCKVTDPAQKSVKTISFTSNNFFVNCPEMEVTTFNNVPDECQSRVWKQSIIFNCCMFMISPDSCTCGIIFRMVKYYNIFKIFKKYLIYNNL